MAKRKVIVIDDEVDAILGAVCDTALKASGMKILSAVSTMVESVIEEDVEGD